MTCVACGQENRGGAKFCLRCGARLQRRCDSCGTALPDGARFCDECGASVAAAPAPAAPADPRSYTPKHLADRILTSRAAIEGERKQVTVLFADVADSTALAERLDPEDMHAVMDRCFQLLLAEVHRYEGTVNQFTGDGIMALFGAPIAHEDAPERAVRAALAIQGAVRAYGEELRASRGIEFRMRLGLNTGVVVVGSIGDDLRMDYTAVGDTTNLAARLQTAAPPGGILISEQTAKLVGGRFVLRPVGALQLKGKSSPVTAHEVVRALPRLPLVAAGEQGLTPLVGRDNELAALATIFGHVRAGRGQIAFVVGEAGMGKSRLLHEYRQRLAGEGVSWLDGRCVSFGRSIPLLPVTDILKAQLGIAEGDGEAAIADKIHGGLASLGSELAAIEPYLRALLTTESGTDAVRGMDAVARRFATFDALKRLLLAAAARQPLVVVIEDLHWIDQASEEFLAYVIDAVATARLLLVCTYRPGYRPTLGERSYMTRIALQPLSPAQTVELAAGTLQAAGIPAAIHRLIAEKSDGNPFFTEEVTKSLVEIGALRKSDHGYELDRPPAEIVIPDRIQDVIMARIDRLGDDSKRAMQVASVIGREFAVRLLQRAAELGERVDALIGELRSLELIYEKSGVPELAYMFKHALTHDVAYESLLVQRRKHLHGIIGQAVEELYADRLSEYWETLAHHFLKAEDWPRAFAYARRAADKARAAYANSEAIYFYNGALEAARHLDTAPEELGALQEGLGLAKLCLSEFGDAAQAFRRALEVVSRPADRARVTGSLATALVWMHEFDAALAAAREALAIAQEVGDDTVASSVMLESAFVHMLRGQIDEAMRLSQASRTIAQHGAHWIVAARVDLYECLRANWRGEFAEALTGFRRLLPQFREANELLVLVEGYSHFGITLGGAGQYAAALTHLGEGIALAESIGDKVWRARMWNTRGWLLGELGADAEAEEANRRCLEFMQALGALRFASEFVANAEINLADLAVWRGDVAGAEPHLAAVRAILADQRNEWMAWRYGMHYHATAAEWAIARNDAGRAREHVDACLATAQRTHSRRYIIRAQRLRASAHAAAGDLASSERLLASVVSEAFALGNPTQRWQALLAHGRVLHALGRRDAARAVWRQAAQLIDDVRAVLPAEVDTAFAESPAVSVVQELAAG